MSRNESDLEGLMLMDIKRVEENGDTTEHSTQLT